MDHVLALMTPCATRASLTLTCLGLVLAAGGMWSPALASQPGAMRVTPAPLAVLPTYTDDRPLELTLVWDNPGGAAGTVDWTQRLWDYVDQQWIESPQRTRFEQGETRLEQVVRVTPARYGVYRYEIDAGEAVDASAVRLNFGYSRAPQPRELPDDWPINLHAHEHDFDGAAMPDGYKRYRVFHHWSRMEPEPGQYDFDAMDAMVHSAAEVGGKVLWVMMLPPAWSLPEEQRQLRGPGRLANLVNDDNREAFRRFLHAFWDRYGPDGTVAPGTVDAIEVWNETNVEAWTHDWSDPEQLVRDYANMTQDIYEVTREKAPDATIVGLSMSSGQHYQRMEQLMDGVARNGKGTLQMLDVISSHTYSEMTDTGERDVVAGQFHGFNARAEQRIGRTLPYWNTEAGVGKLFDDDDHQRIFTQDEVQAHYESIGIDEDAPHRLVTGRWRRVSEKRAGAVWIRGILRNLEAGVESFFAYRLEAGDYSLMRGDRPTLDYLAIGELAYNLQHDWRNVRRVDDVAELVVEPTDRPVVVWEIPVEEGRLLLTYLEPTEQAQNQFLHVHDIDAMPTRLALHELGVGEGRVELRDMYGRPLEEREVDGELTLTLDYHPVYVRVKPDSALPRP